MKLNVFTRDRRRRRTSPGSRSKAIRSRPAIGHFTALTDVAKPARITFDACRGQTRLERCDRGIQSVGTTRLSLLQIRTSLTTNAMPTDHAAVRFKPHGAWSRCVSPSAGLSFTLLLVSPQRADAASVDRAASRDRGEVDAQGAMRPPVTGTVTIVKAKAWNPGSAVPLVSWVSLRARRSRGVRPVAGVQATTIVSSPVTRG